MFRRSFLLSTLSALAGAVCAPRKWLAGGDDWVLVTCCWWDSETGRIIEGKSKWVRWTYKEPTEPMHKWDFTVPAAPRRP